MWHRSYCRHHYSRRFRPWKEGLSTWNARSRSDSGKDLRLNHTIRTCPQHLEMLNTAVPSPDSGQHIAKAWYHDHRRRGLDMDTRCHDWHHLRVRDVATMGDLDG